MSCHMGTHGTILPSGVGIIIIDSPGWLVSLVMGDYLAWFGEHLLSSTISEFPGTGRHAELLTLLVRMGVHPKVFPDRMHTSVSNLVQHGKFH